MLPEDIANEIAEKRNSNSSGQPVVEPKEDESEDKTNDSKTKVEPKKADKPESKKSEAAKPKTNGQSIAQVAEAANNEDDDSEDDEDDSHDGEEHKSKRPRSSLFKEFISMKKELKEAKSDSKKMSRQYTEVAGALTELIDVVKGLKGDKTAQKDEIEEFADNWGLDKDGTKELANILEKRLSTKFSTNSKRDDSDDEDDEEDTKIQKTNKTSELKARQIELAIEGEYEDFIDSYPDISNKINLKAIKRYIIGDEENLEKSFHDVVTEMYPSLLAGKNAIDGGAENVNLGENDEKIDFNDHKVLSQLDKNPKLKDKYHGDLLNRVKDLNSRR